MSKISLPKGGEENGTLVTSSNRQEHQNSSTFLTKELLVIKKISVKFCVFLGQIWKIKATFCCSFTFSHFNKRKSAHINGEMVGGNGFDFSQTRTPSSSIYTLNSSSSLHYTLNQRCLPISLSTIINHLY